MDRIAILKVLESLDVEVVSKHPNSGGYIPCKCPFAPYLHDRGVDSNPSFFVKVDEEKPSGFHCFTCKQKGGRLSSLARKLAYYREEDYTREAMQADLAEVTSSFRGFEDEGEVEEQPEPLNPAVYDNMYPPAWEVGVARKYLEGRDISRKTAELIGLLYDPEEQRILFPIRDRSGDLYGFSGRSVLPSSQFPKGYSRHRDYHFPKERFLLGEHLVEPMKPTFVVEGLFAYATMIEVGARERVNVVAPMMSSLSDYQISRLIDIGEPVYLCFDPDAAGEQGMFGRDGKGGAVAKLKPHLPVMIPPIPDGVDDLDIISPEDFVWMFENAEIA